MEGREVLANKLESGSQRHSFDNKVWGFVYPDTPGERGPLQGVADALKMPCTFLKANRRSGSLQLRAPRVILLKGGGRREEFALRFRKLGSLVVKFAGSRQIDPGPFDLVASSLGSVVGPNVVELPSLASKVTPASLAENREEGRALLSGLPGPITAVLLGGHVSARHIFSADHITKLTSLLKSLQEEQGASLVLLGSRRMQSLPNLIEMHLDPERTLCIPWQSWGGGDNPLLPVLANCDAVLATGDSLSMMSEAASVGKQTHFFGLDLGALRHRRMAEQIISAGFASEISPGDRLKFGDAPRINSTEVVASRIRDLL